MSTGLQQREHLRWLLCHLLGNEVSDHIKGLSNIDCSCYRDSNNSNSSIWSNNNSGGDTRQGRLCLKVLLVNRLPLHVLLYGREALEYLFSHAHWFK